MSPPETSGARDGERILLPRRRDGTPLRCLVVEDEGLIALDLAERLEEWGAAARVAPTVQTALQMGAAMRPDLVLMDVHLPDGDGVRLAARLRELTRAPIVFVTGNKSVDTIQRVLSVGEFVVVPKPVDFRQLRYAIQDVLRE